MDLTDLDELLEVDSLEMGSAFILVCYQLAQVDVSDGLHCK